MGRIVTIEGIRPKDKFQFRIFLPSELATSLGLVSTEMVTGGTTILYTTCHQGRRGCGFEASGLR